MDSRLPFLSIQVTIFLNPVTGIAKSRGSESLTTAVEVLSLAPDSSWLELEAEHDTLEGYHGLSWRWDR